MHADEGRHVRLLQSLEDTDSLLPARSCFQPAQFRAELSAESR